MTDTHSDRSPLSGEGRAGSRRPETEAIHGGPEPGTTSSMSPPIYQSSTFRLRSASHGAELAQTHAPGEFYTRWGNPTTKQAEHVLARLEHAESALLFASGMGAISSLFLGSLSAGEHVVVGRSIYSGVSELVRGVLRRFGVRATFVDARRTDGLEAALTRETRLIFVETPSNPTLDICDLEALARLGRERGIRTAVDSTFATPVNQSPLEMGIDVVVHSATKYLGGHSDLTAGVICGAAAVTEACWRNLKLLGASLSPFESWLLLRGLKTLHVRVARQNRTAAELAEFLERHPEVDRVNYPGLTSHPRHDLASRQMRGFGGMLSFEVRGGYDAAVRLVESLELVQLAVSLGGVETIIQHPASMTHGTLPEEEVRRAGISPGLLRLSVGLEDPADLREDLQSALERSSHRAT